MATTVASPPLPSVRTVERGPSRNQLILRFRRNSAGLFGGLLLGLVGLVAVGAPVVAPTPFDDQRLSERLQPPLWLAGGSLEHPLGTDALGRDLWSRIAYGARTSLVVAAVSVGLAGVVGVMVGLFSGYFGGVLDAIMMRLADMQLTFPYLLLAIAVMALFQPSLVNLIGVLALRSWVVYARTVRSMVISLKRYDFIEAASAIGASNLRIMFRHLAPNVMAPIIVISTVQIAELIILESSLSFLGLGVQPPTPSWGAMLSQGREYLTTAWWMAAFPGLAITITVLGANFFGDGLRDALDPRLKA